MTAIAQPASQADFRTRLEDTVKNRHSKQHPFSKAWAEGELTRPQFGEWVRQHY
ncbi:MAG: iron-containing redox enzyme family protein, partial [Vulcanimicrobiaceae bacterium]